MVCAEIALATRKEIGMELVRYKKYYGYYRMTCDEFIKYVKENKSLFIHYCEIIIANDGTVLLPKNCGHIMMLQSLEEEVQKEKIECYDELTEQLSCTDAIAVWYEFSICYNKKSLGAETLRTFQKIQDEKIISGNLFEKEKR